jgi:hypothetical protein
VIGHDVLLGLDHRRDERADATGEFSDMLRPRRSA